MEGKRNRGEVTAELSEKVWARLCRENALVASEVWVDDARRVDFVAYRPHRPRDRSSNHATAAELESGTFTFVEVKSCMDDFTSGHGRTFEGDENWLVCPLELADSRARRPGNRADMGDAEAEELMRDRCRFSRIDHRHICPDAYPHIGIHTPRHIRAHAYIHTSTIAHMRAGIRHRRTDEQAATPYEIAACSRTEVPPMKEIRDARMGKTSRSASRDPHHSEAIVPVCASGYTGARGNARKHIRPAFQNFL